MKTTLKLLAIGLAFNLNAQIIPSAQQTQQQQQTFYRDATAVVKQSVNPQTSIL